MNKVVYLVFFFLSTNVIAENSRPLADGLSSCAGTYMFAQEIYRNANNDERVEMFQDLSSQYLSAAEASYFLLRDESITPRKIAENNMQKVIIFSEMSLLHRERLPKITCRKHLTCGPQDLNNL